MIKSFMGQFMEEIAEVEHDQILSACLSDIVRECRGLFEDFTEMGDPELAGIFKAILSDWIQIRKEFGEVVHLLMCGAEAVFSIRRNQPEFISTPANVNDPYQAWAFAVSRQILFFNRMTTLASYLDQSTGRQIILEFAEAALERAKAYKVQRRLAYHAIRESITSAVFPDIRRIETVSDFIFASYAVESWFNNRLVQADVGGDFVVKMKCASRSLLTLLESLKTGRELHRRLKGQLDKLENSISEMHGSESAQVETLIIDAVRIFDFYDGIFRSAQSEEMMQLAQKFSVISHERLQQ